MVVCEGTVLCGQILRLRLSDVSRCLFRLEKNKNFFDLVLTNYLA